MTLVLLLCFMCPLEVHKQDIAKLILTEGHYGLIMSILLFIINEVKGNTAGGPSV